MTYSGIMNLETNTIIKGSGTLECVVFNNGTIAPGFSPGSLYVAGLYLHQESLLSMEIQGILPSDYDIIVSDGDIVLDGTLIIDFTGYMGGSGIFTILHSKYGNISKTFDFIQVNGVPSGFICNTEISYNNFLVSISPQVSAIEPDFKPTSLHLEIILPSVFAGLLVVAIVIAVKNKKKKRTNNEQLINEQNHRTYINPLVV